MCSCAIRRRRSLLGRNWLFDQPASAHRCVVDPNRILGLPAKKAANRAALVDPAALDFFIDYAANQTDYPRAG